MNNREVAGQFGFKHSNPSFRAPCARPCGECDRDDHHISDAYFEYADSEPDHEAAKLGHEVWVRCKHCDAWCSIEVFGMIESLLEQAMEA